MPSYEDRSPSISQVRWRVCDGDIRSCLVTFALPDAEVEAYRRSLVHLNLISVVEGSTLSWCEQIMAREAMSEDLLFANVAEPDMRAMIFNKHFRDRMGKEDRGHLKVFPKP